MSTAHDLQRERLLAAVRLQAVADAAGVSFPVWASTTNPRVLPGDAAGYLAGLHRGRLPAVEVFQAADRWDRQATSGGVIASAWTLRVHVPDRDKATAESRARLILCTALAAIRSDDYLREGEEEFDAMQYGPLGHSLAVQVTLAHTYCRSTYETDATITPGDPVVVLPSVGGYTFRFDIATPGNPVLAFTVPAGQALDNVELHVEEVWNGAGAAVLVGDGTTVDRFLGAGDVELDLLATFERDFDDAPGPIPVVVTFAPGTGATTGRCRLQISTTAAGS
jgi:hypothetical protein